MRWWMIVGLQYTLARVPSGPLIYSELQRRFGDLRDVGGSGRFDKVEHFLRNARQTCGPLDQLTVVELGTGWIPVLPMAFAASGASVYSYDVSPLVDDQVFRKTRDGLFGRIEPYAAAAGQKPKEFRSRLKHLPKAKSFSQGCISLRMHYDGGADTTDLPHDDESVDLVISSLVLQCMPAEAVNAVLEESLRILKPGGHAIHRIRMTDEVAIHDMAKNHFDYLMYDRDTYDRWFNNNLKYLNRLRASQFLARMKDAGFIVYKADQTIDTDNLDYVRNLPVDEMFHECSLEDLATTNLDVILVKPVSTKRDRTILPAIDNDSENLTDAVTAVNPIIEKEVGPANAW